MKIRVDVLRRFVDLPAELAAVRALLDDVGVEVKRVDPAALGGGMTLELLANRGDHHGYAGIAREVSGRTGAALRSPTSAELEVGEGPWPVRLETPLCPLYTVTRLDRVTAGGALSADALAVLDGAGLASKGPVIDATNVASLELGQPTHAFDAARVRGPITVRETAPGERAWPLFQAGPVELPAGTLVIADDEKILAVAGVIGCEESKTTDETTSVLLESAAFDPVAVRKAARALGLSTDSSARFERGSDAAAVLPGAGRVVALLASAGWTVSGATGRHGAWRDPSRVIRFDPAEARRFLGVETSDSEIVARLERYGYRFAPDSTFDVRTGAPTHPERLAALVPTWRLWDAEHPADLYEDLARSLGYDDTPTALPPIDMGALPSDDEVARSVAEEVLLGHGFYEVITDGFYGRPIREKLGLTEAHALWAHVETANALDRAYSLLKNNTLAQAVELVATNLAVRVDELKAYEWTRTFHPDPTAPNGTCTERRVLWAVALGSERPRTWAGASRAADALWLKGVVGELAAALGVELSLARLESEHALAGLLHPHRALAVQQGGVTVGVIGEVHPEVLAGFRIKRGRPVFLEIDEAALVVPARRPAYREPPARQPVERDLAFTLPGRVEAARVVDALRAAGPAWLTQVRITDRFDHEVDGAPVVTWTFALTFSAEEADRTTEALNAACAELVDAVHTALGGSGVRLR